MSSYALQIYFIRMSAALDALLVTMFLVQRHSLLVQSAVGVYRVFCCELLTFLSSRCFISSMLGRFTRLRMRQSFFVAEYARQGRSILRDGACNSNS